MEWRISTFKATDRFRDKDHQLSLSTRNRIWNFLRPIQTKNADAERKGVEKLLAICENAEELGLMIRQSKDEFKVDVLEDAVNKHISDWDEVAEEIASIPAPPGVEPGTIAYVIAGALVKSPKENLERVLVLEKAEVAVYE
jgi:Ribonuclease G/E